MWKLSLQTLQSFFGYLGKSVTAPMALFKKTQGAAKYLLWAIHLAAVAGVAVLLYFVGVWTEIDLAVRVPSQILRTGWLSLLFLLGYSLIWLGWYLWKVSHKLTQGSEFPDIDAAWEAGLSALQQRGINLNRTPLYLVIGKPQAGSSSWLAASNLPLEVTPTPDRADAPLQIAANRDAIFVHCTGASLLSRQASRFAEAMATANSSQTALRTTSSVADFGATPSADALETDFLVDGDSEWNEDLGSRDSSDWRADGGMDFPSGGSVGSDSSGSGGTAVAEIRTAAVASEVAARVDKTAQTVGLLIEAHEAETDAAPLEEVDHYRLALVTRQDEIDELAARVRHVAGLIRDQREPFAGVNGVLALISAEATRNEHQAQHVAMLAQRELHEICSELDLQCPVVGVICDLEQLPGCKELLKHFPAAQRERRFGMRLPNFSAADWKSVPKMLEQSVRWVCEQLAPALAYRIAARSGQSDKPISATRGAAVFQFLAELRKRMPGIERLLLRGLCPDLQRTKGWHFAGWYFAATGRDAVSEQAFLPGVTTQLADMQNSLAWTQDARRMDSRLRRYAIFAYVAIAVSGVICASLLMKFAAQW